MAELFEKFIEKCVLKNPVSDSELSETESKLIISLPSELRNLLKKTNGISTKYGISLIWSANKILEENLSFRANENFKELYMSFENLLFFGDEANGDLFAFIVLENVINRNDIFIWEHETDSRNWFAPNLEKYFEKRLTENL